ncbi:MAG: metabolite traffic protein EboE [Thermohalobaculum sp.]
MRTPDGRGWLTYCLNIHPAESWQAVRSALRGPTRAIKARVSPDAPFAVGLRFSAETVRGLADPAARADLARILAAEDYRAVTVNGFPYGPFHGTRVKEDVYQPDWRSTERLAYTTALADLMAEIAPEGETVSLSTVPGTFKPLGVGAEAQMAANYLRAAAHCARLRDRTGVEIAIAIEPEPCCFLETIAESVAFFDAHLFSNRAVRMMADLAGLTRGEAAAALPRHLGLCYDVCHAAVEYEDPAASVATLRAAGVPVHKLQLSSALRIARVDPAARAALAAFDEPTYLHQVVARRGKELTRVSDLPEALGRGTAADGSEWRVHFHVPIFVRELPDFDTTQDFLTEMLALHRVMPVSPHLEVETYTWGVLPEALTGDGLEAAVARELEWVKERLA